MKRKKCRIAGCNSLVTHSGYQGEKTRKRKWRTVCQKHHRAGRVMRDSISNACSKCTWRGRVHRHRFDRSVGYIEGNYEILCPNCHEAAHGRGEWNRMQSSSL